MTTSRTPEIPLVAVAGPEPRYRPAMAWTVLLLLAVFMVLNFADRISLALAAQPLMKELHLSASQFGLISSSFYFLYSLSAVGVGFLATRHVPLKWLLFVMSLLWAATQLPVFFFAGGGVLLATRIGLGAAEGPATAVANSTAYSWFPREKRGLPTAVLTSGASLAKIVAAPLLTLLIVHSGWRSAFFALGLAGLVWCAVWLFAGRTGPFAVTPEAPGKVDRAARRRTFLKVARSRTFIVLLLATYPMYALISVVFSWFPSYLEAGLGFSTLTSGVLFGLPSVIGMVFMLGSGWLTDRLLARGVSARIAHGLVPTLSLAAGGVLLVVLPLAGSARYLAYVILVAGYCLTLVAQPIVYAAIGTAAAPSQRTSVLSLFIALQSTSGIIAPWATGALIDGARNQVDGYNTAFVVIGILCAIGGVVAAFFVDSGRDSAHDA
ncbi:MULTISPECIES: MFS transporter [unclassified Amycolatopsis]|uniref:MFS transporter n=1 Tax=unclassified Amycolatopsis TaxID=2618356 RepID=UPI0034564038